MMWGQAWVGRREVRGPGASECLRSAEPLAGCWLDGQQGGEPGTGEDGFQLGPEPSEGAGAVSQPGKARWRGSGVEVLF